MVNLGLNNIKKILIDFSQSQKMIDRIKSQFDYNSLNKVRISVRNNTFSQFIKLQTPGQGGVWGNTAFVTCLNPDLNLVINKPNPYMPLCRDTSKNWMLHIEPPGYIKKLRLDDPRVMAKFGRVYTPDPDLYGRGGKFIASPPYVHWHLALSSYTSNPQNAVYDYDFLKSQHRMPEKYTNLVVINSNMNDLPGHKLRADFISKISEGGLNYDLYGTPNWSIYKQYKGRTTEGKWPIYSRSKYVLAIENEISDYYWTEKFTDAILCFSFPIYHGCPRISQYFPEGSYIPLDIRKKSAADDLHDIITSDFYVKNFSKLVEARNRVLERENMFSFINSQIENHK